MFRFVPRERLDGAARRLRGGLRRRPRGRLPAALLRPAVVSDRRGGSSGRRTARTGRAEHRHDRRRPDPGAAVPGGEVHPRGSRRPRRLGIARGSDAGADPAAHASSGPRVVGGEDPADRRRGGGDRTRPPAHREPRRAPAGPHPSRPAAAVPVPRRLPPAADAGLLPAGDERRAGQHRALAPRPLARAAPPSSSAPTGRSWRRSRPIASAARRSCAARWSAPGTEGAEELAPLPFVLGDGPPLGPWARQAADAAPGATVSDLVFVGGTGRSGTHVIARLLGQHSRYEMIPIECRFHCNPSGLADVVTGKATPEEFVAKLRKFWWHRVRHGGHALARGGVAGAAGRQGARPPQDHCPRPLRGSGRGVRGELPRRRRSQASRALFFDLLGPLAADAGKPALVEMSCFTIASAPGLARIFPEARFVHAVRDGRDSASSKAAKRQKEHHPTGVTDGIEWWLGRLRLAEEGVRGLDDPGARGPDQPRRAGLGRPRARLRRPARLPRAVRRARDARVLQLADERRRGPPRALARGASPRPDQEVISRRYEAALAQLDAEGYHCAAVLRRSYEQGAARV